MSVHFYWLYCLIKHYQTISFYCKSDDFTNCWTIWANSDFVEIQFYLFAYRTYYKQNSIVLINLSFLFRAQFSTFPIHQVFQVPSYDSFSTYLLNFKALSYSTTFLCSFFFIFVISWYPFNYSDIHMNMSFWCLKITWTFHHLFRLSTVFHNMLIYFVSLSFIF